MSSVSDTVTSFSSIPWVSRILSQPNIITTVSPSRTPKSSLEDSLYAETLKTPRTLRSCLCAYSLPSSTADHVDEVSIFVSLGDGMNGFPGVLHGGITATLMDECMGMFQTIDAFVGHAAAVEAGRKTKEELPPKGVSSFTVELKVTYLKQVRAPGCLVVVVKKVKTEGRKRWLRAEIRQPEKEDGEGELRTCAVGEALFVEPRESKI